MDQLRLDVPEGGQISVLDFGGDGPDVLMLHHIGLGPLEWRQTVAALGGRIRAVSLGLRGHGGASAPALRGMAGRADLHLTVRELGLDRPVLALAGWISSTFGLAAAVEEPQQFRSVVTVNGTIQPTRRQIEEEIDVVNSPQMLAYFRDRFRMDEVVATRADLEILVANKVAHMGQDWLIDESAEVEAEVWAGIREMPGGWSTSPASQDLTSHYIFDPDDPLFPDRGLYERLTVPLHIVHCTESWDYTSDALEFELERDDPPIVVHQLEAGHFPMYSHPEQIARIVRAAAGC